jgi:hypothetical protein
MRRLFWLSFLLLCLVPIALAGVLLAALDERPLVERAVDLDPERLAQGQRILDGNDPRKLKPGQVKTVRLTQADLDLAANYLAHRFAHGGAQVSLRSNVAALAVTVPLPAPMDGRYVNVMAELLPKESGLPEFKSFKLGEMAVPTGLANWLAAYAVASVNGQDAVDAFADSVKRLEVGPGSMTVVYQWQADLPARLSSALVPAGELERLRAYRQAMVQAGMQARKPTSLADLLPPLFRLAAERSAGDGGPDPVAENRATIAVLTFYVNQRGLDKVVPGAEPWPKAAVRTVKLNGRDDFPKHFMISAAIAATADSPLSDAIGLYKEVKDSRGGSGFSFNDLAADRAGSRLGEMASASPEAALYLQARLKAGLREADFMPSTEGLPEFMPEPEFKRRFGGIGAPAYTQMMMEIERRVAALPLYRR